MKMLDDTKLKRGIVYRLIYTTNEDIRYALVLGTVEKQTTKKDDVYKIAGVDMIKRLLMVEYEKRTSSTSKKEELVKKVEAIKPELTKKIVRHTLATKLEDDEDEVVLEEE
jgi:hypothetical protein